MSAGIRRSRPRALGARMAAGLAVLALAGGVLPGTAGASRAGAEKVTLQLSLQDLANAHFLPYVEDFEAANPNITVEVAQYPQAQYASVLRNQIAAGDPPDVMISNSAYAGQGIGVLTLADSNLLENLSKESWAKNISPENRAGVAQGKKVYAPPLGISVIPVWYNQKVLDENALEIPKTYAEFLDYCETLSAKDILPVSLGAQFTVAIGMLLNGLSANTVGAKDPGFAQKRLDGKATFAGNKQWKATLDHFVEMNEKGCFGEQPVAEGFTAAQEKFATGKAATFMFSGGGGGTLVDGLKRINPALDVTYAVFPGAKASDSRLAATVGFVPVILKGSDEKKAAKKLVAFLAKNANEIARAGGSAPVSGPVPSQFADLAPAIEGGQTVLWADTLWPNTSVAAALQSGAQDLLLGRRSVDDVLAAMDAAFDLS